MPSIQYISDGRGGTVIYADETSSIRIYYEFGANDCVAILFIPTADRWEQETGRALSERNAILHWIAERVCQDQVSQGYYQITDGFIELYRK
jgi:hypothetical protein